MFLVGSPFISRLIRLRKVLNLIVAQVQGVEAWMVNIALFTILSYWGNQRGEGRSEVHKTASGVKQDRSC